MFVRWQQYRSQNRRAVKSYRKQKDETARLRAILVKAVRVDGEPRQQHIAYLASIERDRLRDIIGRVMFWRRAWQVLDRLGNRLTADERAHVELLLAKRVRPPTPNQVRELEQVRARLGLQD